MSPAARTVTKLPGVIKQYLRIILVKQPTSSQTRVVEQSLTKQGLSGLESKLVI